MAGGTLLEPIVTKKEPGGPTGLPKPGTTDFSKPHWCIQCGTTQVKEEFDWDTGADLWECPSCNYSYPRNSNPAKKQNGNTEKS